MEQEPKSLGDLLYRCTVRVDVGGKKKGTGFFVAPGLVITCAHVVEGSTGESTTQPIDVYWHWGRQHYPVRIQNGAFLPKPYPDLALLRIDEPSEHPCVYLDRDGDLQLGAMLYSYGYTQEYPNGDSAFFDYEGPSHEPDFLKLKNAQASHGMSGAPLLDQRTGAVCGIIKKSRNPNSDLGGRAVPASTITSVFPELPTLQDVFHERNRIWISLRPRSVTTDNITLTNDPINGAVANKTSPQGRVLMRSHAGPVSLLPRAEAGFLDRRSEVEATTAVLEGGSPAEFHGPVGVGKTTILHQLSNQEFAKPFPDGIVFFRVWQEPLEDLLLELLKTFYDLEPSYKPTSIEIRSYLQNTHALIVLDDVDLDRDQIGELMDAAPGCTFLLASTKRCLWGQGRAVALRGLPSEDGVSLIERELEHVLSTEERSLAAQVCAAVGGYPQSLLEVSGLMRDQGVSLVDVAEQIRRHAGSAAEAVTEQVLMALTENQERVLAALASLGGARVGEQHVSALAEVEDIQGVLGALQGRFLVQAHSPRYSLAGSLSETLQEKRDLTPWKSRALEYFTDWAEEHRHAPQLILEEIDALLKMLEWAAQEGHWERALHLGRAVERALILSGRWGAWSQVLAWQLEAAEGLEDIAAKAWALHQSGTRALCLEEAPAARAALTEALRLRESLGDDEGAAVTRHNLGLLEPPVPWWRSKLWQWMIVVVAMLLLILLLLGVLALAGLGPFSGDRDGASVVVRPKSLNFGEQEVDTQSKPRSVTLANGGSTLLKIIDVRTSDDFNQQDDCDNVEPEESCSIDVTFKPTTQGDHNGTLKIINNASSNPREVLLSGKGIVQEPGTTNGTTTNGTTTNGTTTNGTTTNGTTTNGTTTNGTTTNGTTTNGTTTNGTTTNGTTTTVTCANNGKDDDGDSSIDEPDDCNVVE